jgi:hypothetical protein
MTRERRYRAWKRRRIGIGIAGFIIGFAIGMLITYSLYSVYINVTTFAAGCAGAALTLIFAEKKNLPTTEEVEKLRFEEKLNPLGISTSGSIKRDESQQTR